MSVTARPDGSVQCRFDDEEATEVFLVPQGCFCHPEDRVQALCPQHVERASPLGGMVAVGALLLALSLAACSGSRPAPKPPAPPEPTVTSSPAPSPDAPATPRPPRPDDSGEPDGANPTPKPGESPKAHELVEVCHIGEDGEGRTLRVREGTFEEPGSRRWHLHRHRGRGDYAGPCKKRELRDVVQEP